MKRAKLYSTFKFVKIQISFQRVECGHLHVPPRDYPHSPRSPVSPRTPQGPLFLYHFRYNYPLEDPDTVDKLKSGPTCLTQPIMKNSINLVRC